MATNKTDVEVDLDIHSVKGLLTLMKCNISLKGVDESITVTRKLNEIVESSPDVSEYLALGQFEYDSEDSLMAYDMNKKNFISIDFENVVAIEPLDEQLMKDILIGACENE